VFTRSPLRRVIVLSDGSSRKAPKGRERHGGKAAQRRHLRCPRRQDWHVADGHRIAPQPCAKPHADRQFLGPFQQRAAGDAFKPRLHLPRDLAQVETQPPRARLVDLKRQLGRAARDPSAHHGDR
jgi:hypothetical protein